MTGIKNLCYIVAFRARVCYNVFVESFAKVGGAYARKDSAGFTCPKIPRKRKYITQQGIEINPEGL